MKPDPEMVLILSLGLEAMNYRLTASRGGWKRYGKFRFWDDEGGDAYYILPDGSLWYSRLCFTEPDFEEKGPFRDRVFEAGMQAREPAELDADQMLDELGK